MIGNSRRLRSRARSITSRQAFDPRSPTRMFGQPTHVSTQGKVGGRASCGRGEAYNLPLSHIADLVENLFRHGEAGRSKRRVIGGACWGLIGTRCFLKDAQLEKRLLYQSGCL